jgi:hypothetical protein
MNRLESYGKAYTMLTLQGPIKSRENHRERRSASPFHVLGVGSDPSVIARSWIMRSKETIINYNSSQGDFIYGAVVGGTPAHEDLLIAHALHKKSF